MTQFATIEAWITALVDETMRNSDSVILVVGREGTGKSSLAYEASLACHKVLRQRDPTAPDFTADNITFHAGEYVRKSADSPPRSIMILDEAIRGGYNRRAMGKDNIALTEDLFVNRVRNTIQFICFPNLERVDGVIKDHRAQWLLRIIRRGAAVLHKAERYAFGNGGTYWKPVLSFQFPPPSGPIWAEYERRKARFATSARSGGPDLEVEVDGIIARIRSHVLSHMVEPVGPAPNPRPGIPSARARRDTALWSAASTISAALIDRS